jgi:AcrR family transcriptional regulator
MQAKGRVKKRAGSKDGRLRILEAAVRSFAEHGYAGTMTAAVAREAGVTQPLVHHHFGSKEGLWKAAMAHLFGDLPMLDVETQRASSTEDLLRRLIEPFVRLSAIRPELLRVIQREGSRPSRRLTHLLDHHIGPALTVAVETIRKAQRDGLIDRTLRPELLLFFAMGAGSHVFDVAAIVRQAFDIDVTTEATREAFVEVFHHVLVHGVLAKPRRARS